MCLLCFSTTVVKKKSGGFVSFLELQPSLTHFSLILARDLVGSRPLSRRSQGWVLWSLLKLWSEYGEPQGNLRRCTVIGSYL